MQLCSHVDTQTVKRFKREYVAFVMLQVRENEISLRKWSDGTAQFRTLEGTLAVTFATWPLIPVVVCKSIASLTISC